MRASRSGRRLLHLGERGGRHPLRGDRPLDGRLPGGRSGRVPPGRLLTAAPAGNPLHSASAPSDAVGMRERAAAEAAGSAGGAPVTNWLAVVGGDRRAHRGLLPQRRGLPRPAAACRWSGPARPARDAATRSAPGTTSRCSPGCCSAAAAGTAAAASRCATRWSRRARRRPSPCWQCCWGPPGRCPAYWWAAGVAIALTLTDLDVRRIPDRILVPGVVGTVVLLAAGAFADGEPHGRRAGGGRGSGLLRPSPRRRPGGARRVRLRGCQARVPPRHGARLPLLGSAGGGGLRSLRRGRPGGSGACWSRGGRSARTPSPSARPWWPAPPWPWPGGKPSPAGTSADHGRREVPARPALATAPAPNPWPLRCRCVPSP